MERSEGEKGQRQRAPVAGVLIAVDGSLVDPQDEGALDKLLADSLGEGSEPRLLIVERLLSRLRIRREV